MVHVAACDPPGARRDADLVAGAVVADHRSGRVRAVAIVVERRGEVLDRVEPVEVVAGGTAGPAPVFPAKRRMGPLDPRVRRGHDDPLATGAVEAPNLVRVDPRDAPFRPCGRRDRRRRQQIVLDAADERIADDAHDLVSRGKFAGEIEVAGHGQPVDEVKRAEGDAGFRQLVSNAGLCAARTAAERVVNRTAGLLRGAGSGQLRAEIGRVVEEHEERFLARRCEPGHQPRRDLGVAAGAPGQRDRENGDKGHCERNGSQALS